MNMKLIHLYMNSFEIFHESITSLLIENKLNPVINSLSPTLYTLAQVFMNQAE